jgi:plastocyanin domain-containing protein
MEQQSKLIQNVCIGVIVVAVLISGYIILKPNGQTGSQAQNDSGLAPMVDGKQVLAMTVKSVSYSPNSFKVKAGVPVRWEITSSGEPGCDAGEVLARGLTDPIYLNPNAGQVTTAEFTPQSPGIYHFNCPMNMVRGTIEVVN